MKKNVLILCLTIVATGLALVGFKTNPSSPTPVEPVKFKIITTIESIVQGGIGRSRIIENGTELDYNQFTTERTDGKKSNQGKIKRGDAKVERFSETKIL